MRCVRSLAGLLLAVGAACAEHPRPEGDGEGAGAAPAPEAAFRAQLGREWELVRLGTREIPPPPPGTPPDSLGRDLVPGRRPTLRFSAEPPGAGGRSFCNGYGGPFVLHGDSLRISEIVSSAVGCDGPDSLETRFFRGLWMTRRFTLESDSLTLLTEDGTRLVFVPAAP